MKKILLVLILGFSLFSGNEVFAEDAIVDGVSYGDKGEDTTTASSDNGDTGMSTNPGSDLLKPDFRNSTDSYNESIDMKGNMVSGKEGTTGTDTSSDTISITVTERIPGANCTPETGDGPYTCSVKKGFEGVTSTMGAIIKWLTYLTGLAAVLFIVINALLYMGSGVEDSLKTEAKKRITQTIIGIIVLLLTGVILNTIAPWIYK